MNVNSYPDLISWRSSVAEPVDVVEPWRPRTLMNDQWPPNYKAVYAWRIKQLDLLRNNPEMLISAKAYYSTRPDEFIMHWMDTYNPRKATTKWMPFVFFKRQAEFIQFLHECRGLNESGLVEKCRDAGVTWLACAYAVWSWIFTDDDAIGWGSRKENLVDKLGNPDSIFEKMRLILRRLPDIWLPAEFNQTKHATFMRIINPENGSIIMGEAGDNIGRGGRTSFYLKDESSHYVRPELIEAALGDNTNVQIDISSVNGLNNPFHRRRKAGVDWAPGKHIEPGFVRVFIFDWRDHPEKTQEWYDRRKAKYEREGLLHVFAQEVDRNYSAAIQNTIIPYEWIQAAVDAHKKFKWIDKQDNEHFGIPDFLIPNVWSAGLDVADGGEDTNALCIRQWIIWRDAEEWGERDTGVSTRKTIVRCREHKGINIQYDSIGIGASVKSEFNRLVDEKLVLPDELRLTAWNAGAAVVNPFDRIIPDDDESEMNQDMFRNMKAQAWWAMRTRFYKTFKNITEGVIYPFDEMISLDSTMTLLDKIMQELAQATVGSDSALRMIVNKTPDGTKSPNLADSGIMSFFPIDNSGQSLLVGKYGI